MDYGYDKPNRNHSAGRSQKPLIPPSNQHCNHRNNSIQDRRPNANRCSNSQDGQKLLADYPRNHPDKIFYHLYPPFEKENFFYLPILINIIIIPYNLIFYNFVPSLIFNTNSFLPLLIVKLTTSPGFLL